MKKMISLALVGLLVLASVVPAHAHGWEVAAVLLGGLFLGSVLAAPYYGYPYYPYTYGAYSAPLYVSAPAYQTVPYVSNLQRSACYPPAGCYQLYGDGVTRAYQWVWVPAPPSGPPPSTQPPR